MPVATTKHANQKLSLCPLLASKFFCYISPPHPHYIAKPPLGNTTVWTGHYSTWY